jgi:hypothetical protein
MKHEEIEIMEKKIALLEIEIKYLTETFEEVSKTINLLYQGVSLLRDDSGLVSDYPKKQVIRYEI